VGTICDSFCNPSRGLTSTILTWDGNNDDDEDDDDVVILCCTLDMMGNQLNVCRLDFLFDGCVLLDEEDEEEDDVGIDVDVDEALD
jgi:hypothetical protein